MDSPTITFSRWPAARTNGLGEVAFAQPPGTFALTPASEICMRAICDHNQLLRGRGLDWGSGVGCLAIIAARITAVQEVIGLDISPPNVAIATENARGNGVGAKTRFLLADSFEPASDEGRRCLGAFRGATQFILANPPSSEGDDGFEYRRRVLRGAREYLVEGGVVFLNISLQYGAVRTARLSSEVAGFVHEGVLSSSDWVPFDLARPDLLACLYAYAAEEARGGEAYSFADPRQIEAGATTTARAALARFRETGASPLSRWQTHLFRRVSSDAN